MKHTAFKWTILRAGGLSKNNPGEGKTAVGRTHLGEMISVKTPRTIHPFVDFINMR